MKHVFAISSHLTFYLCNHYIELENLDRNDCILFLTRFYRIPPHHEANFPNQIHTNYNLTGTKEGRVFAGANVFKTRRNIREFDRIVDEQLQGADFVWYAQICSNDIFSMMVTKKNCVGYYIIEDGLDSYRNFNPQTFSGYQYLIYKFALKPLWPRIFTLKNYFISTDSEKYRGCIAIRSDCFPLHQDKLRVIGNPFEKVELPIKPDAILSVDSWYLYTKDIEVVKAIYKDVAQLIKDKKYNTFYYKFHPNLYALINSEYREAYRAAIQEIFGANTMELEADICLENILNSYQCDFYTSFSSVAMYVPKNTNTCYSFQRIMRKHGIDVSIPEVSKNEFVFL